MTTASPHLCLLKHLDHFPGVGRRVVGDRLRVPQHRWRSSSVRVSGIQARGEEGWHSRALVCVRVRVRVRVRANMSAYPVGGRGLSAPNSAPGVSYSSRAAPQRRLAARQHQATSTASQTPPLCFNYSACVNCLPAAVPALPPCRADHTAYQLRTAALSANSIQFASESPRPQPWNAGAWVRPAFPLHLCALALPSPPSTTITPLSPCRLHMRAGASHRGCSHPAPQLDAPPGGLLLRADGCTSAGRRWVSHRPRAHQPGLGGGLHGRAPRCRCWCQGRNRPAPTPSPASSAWHPERRWLSGSGGALQGTPPRPQLHPRTRRQLHAGQAAHLRRGLLRRPSSIQQVHIRHIHWVPSLSQLLAGGLYHFQSFSTHLRRHSESHPAESS